MLSYSSVKINIICNFFKKTLKSFKININKCGQIIDEKIIRRLEDYLASLQVAPEKFVKTPCPKCGECHLEVMDVTYDRNIIFRIRKSFD